MLSAMSVVLFSLVVGHVAGAGVDGNSKSPAEDYKMLQGKWGTTWSEEKTDQNVHELIAAMAVVGKGLSIRGNKLLLTESHAEAAMFANDLDLPRIQREVDEEVKGDRLMLLTVNSGKSILVSYAMQNGVLTIRYPAGACSRSGTIIQLERPKVE